MGNSGSKAPDQVFASSGGESRRIEESSTAQYVGLENVRTFRWHCLDVMGLYASS